MMSISDIDSALIWMIAFMCLLSLSQKGKRRTEIAIIFSFLAAIHAAVFWAAMSSEIAYNPYLYYLSAALINFFVIIRIYKMESLPEMGVHMFDISLFSLVFNLFGWFVSNLAIIPLEYSMLYIGIYAMAIYAMMIGEPKDGAMGDNKNNLRIHSFHPHAH